MPAGFMRILPLENDDTALTRFAGLSIAAAVATITLEALAFAFTGSLGLLSDALESGVNLVAAVGALVALAVAARPADEHHHYGHSKPSTSPPVSKGR